VVGLSWFYRAWFVEIREEVVEPLAEVRVERDRVVIAVDLPGASRERVRVEAGEDYVLIEADGRVGGLGCRYRKLVRTPVKIDPSRVRARMVGGVLVVEAPLLRRTYREVKVE